MRGEREYEFVGVGVFVAEGDARFLARMLAAYGYSRDQFGPGLRRRLLAWGILHKYSHLPGECGGCPSRSGPRSARSLTAGSPRSYPSAGFPMRRTDGSPDRVAAAQANAISYMR